MKKVLSILSKIIFFLLPFPIMALIVYLKARKLKKEKEAEASDKEEANSSS